MGNLTIDKIIEIQVRAIMRSTSPEDLGFEGEIRDKGTLEYIVMMKETGNPTLFAKRPDIYTKSQPNILFFRGKQTDCLVNGTAHFENRFTSIPY